MNRNCFSCFSRKSLWVLLLSAAFAASAFAQNTLPVVSIYAPDAQASESGNPGLFKLFRDGPTNLALNIFCVIEGTASNDVDYAKLPEEVTIPAGIRSVPLPVIPKEDDLIEGTESVVVRLVYPPVMPTADYLIGWHSNAMVTMADNDPPPTNQPPNVYIYTPTDAALLTAPVNLPVCAWAEDADGRVDTVEFFAGTNSLGLRTNCNWCPGPMNTFCLVWTNVPPGNYELTAKATDNDGASAVSPPVHISVQAGPLPPIVTLRATDPYASEPGVLTVIDPGVFKVTRYGNTNDDLIVHYSIRGTASNGVDYVAISNAVVIPAGRLAAEIEILPLPDDLLEGTETVALRLEDIACIAIFPPPPGCYRVGTPREAVVYIADSSHPTNLPPRVQLVKPRDGQLFLAPTNVLLVADTTDRDGYVGKVEFFADANKLGEQTKLFFVPPPPGEHIPYDFVWTNPPPGLHVLKARATDDDGASAESEAVRIWIVATNDLPHTNLPVVTITAPDAIASEGTNWYCWLGWTNYMHTNLFRTNTATFVVRRSGSTNDALAVYYRVVGTASNGVDYAALPGVITVPAGRRAAEFKLVPIDDALPERIETVVLELRMPPDATTLPPPYLVGFPGRAAVIIVDNDQPRPATGMLSDRSFHFTRPGDDGTWWRIECSTDLVHWSVLGTNRVMDGALDFVDPDGDELPQRFYRAVPELNPPPIE